MGEMIVAHNIRHGLKANQQIKTDGLRRMDTMRPFIHLYVKRATDFNRRTVACYKRNQNVAPQQTRGRARQIGTAYRVQRQ